MDSARLLGITWYTQLELRPSFCSSGKISGFSHALFTFLHIIISLWKRLLLPPHCWIWLIQLLWGTEWFPSRPLPGEPAVLLLPVVFLHGQGMPVEPGLQIKVESCSRWLLQLGKVNRLLSSCGFLRLESSLSIFSSYLSKHVIFSCKCCVIWMWSACKGCTVTTLGLSCFTSYLKSQWTQVKYNITESERLSYPKYTVQFYKKGEKLYLTCFCEARM